jgi:SAM-dependent methyltransferase
MKVLFALYPLLQGDYRAVERAIASLEASGIPHRTFTTHSELSGEAEAIFQALQRVFAAGASEGATAMWALFLEAPELDPFRREGREQRFPPEAILNQVLGEDIRSVLDIGTGTGFFAEAFARRGLFTVGLDPRNDRLEIARARVPQARFVEGRAEALPFPNQSFDLAFFGLSLHHLQAPQALREAARVAHHLAVLEWPYRTEEIGPPLERRLSPSELTHLCQDALGASPRILEAEGYLLALL